MSSASATAPTVISVTPTVHLLTYPFKSAILQQRRKHPVITLKAQTQDCILWNKEFFSTLANLNPGKNPFDRISNKMKKELIERDFRNRRNVAKPKDSFEVQCHVLQLLLNPKITSMSLPTNFFNEENLAVSTDLCHRLLAVQLPVLHTLANWSDVHNCGEIKLLFSNVLDALANIEVLEFSGLLLSDKELCRMANQLPKLRVLDVSLSMTEVTRAGILALSNLKSFKKFYFEAFRSDYRTDVCAWKTEMMKLCFELLPNLHLVGFKPQDSDEDSPMGKINANALASLGTQQRTLKLHGLMLDKLCRIPECIALPELRYLCLISPVQITSLDSERFPQLSELVLYDIESHNLLMQIIGQVGRQLRCLNIEVHAIVQLDKLLDECPDLSQLLIRVNGVCSSSELQPHTLKRLNTLVVHFEDDTQGIHHQPELLIDLLRLAPKLSSVDLKFHVIHVELFKQLSLLAKQRNCLRHLQQFGVWSNRCHCKKRQRTLMESTLLTLVNECVKLDDVSFQIDDSSEFSDSD